MQIKPKIIDLVKVYFIPLERDLLPCLSGIVMSLVPGLEEQNSEHYHSVMKVLDDLSIGVGKRPFYHALWKTLYLNPSTRIGVLHYFLDRMPKNSADLNLDLYMPNHHTLVLNALIASVQDSVVLVQRTVLDLLLIHFQLDQNIFTLEETSRLMKHVILVHQRREISLNRRVYNWILGPQENDQEYYSKYSKEALVNALKSLFNEEFTKIEEAVLPFKIVYSLFDKPEISGPIIGDILQDILYCLHKYKEGPFSQEITTQVNSIVEGLKQEVVWSFITKYFEDEFKTISSHSNMNGIYLLDSLLDKMYGINTKESQTTFLPNLLNTLMKYLIPILKASNFDAILKLLQLSLKVIGKILPYEDEQFKSRVTESSIAFQSFFTFYFNQYFTSFLESESKRGSSQLISQINQSKIPIQTSIYDYSNQLLVTFLTHFNIDIPFELQTNEWLNDLVKSINSHDSYITCISIRTFADLSSLKPKSSFVQFMIKNRYPLLLAKKLWSLLSPSNHHLHYKVVQLYLNLKSSFPEFCEDAIAEELLVQDIEKKVENYQRFALLWRLSGEISFSSNTFTKSLFLMLDSLNDEQPMVRLAGRTWLADSISKIERILDCLLAVLLDKTTARLHSTYQMEYDCRRVLYVFKVLRSIIDCDFKLFIDNIIEKPISKELQDLNSKQIIPQEGSNQTIGIDDFSFVKISTYLDLFVIESLRFIAGQAKINSSPDFVVKNSMVQSTAASFLQYLLLKITNYPKAVELAKVLHQPVLESLAQAASSNNLMLQVNLLGLLRSVILIDANNKSKSNTDVHDSNDNSDGAIDAIGNSSMFQQTLSIGLLQKNTDFNIRFYWLDFMTSCLPYMTPYLYKILPSIFDCFCNIVNGYSNVYDSMCSKDVLMLLKSIYKIMSFALSSKQSKKNHLQRESSTGISGFFKNIFQVDSTEHDRNAEKPEFDEASKASIRAMVDKLPELMSTIIKIWGAPSPSLKSNTISKSPSLRTKKWLMSNNDDNTYGFSQDESHNRYALQDQIISILETFFDISPMEFVLAMLEDWTFSPYGDTELSLEYKLICIDIINTMGNTESSVIVNAVFKLLQWSHHQDKIKFQQMIQQNNTSNKGKSSIPSTHVHDSVIIDFLYCLTEWETKISEKSLSSYVSIMKELFHSHNPHSILLMFKAFDSYISRISKIQSKLTKKEVQPLITRMIEIIISIINQTFIDLSESWRLNVKFSSSKQSSKYDSDFYILNPSHDDKSNEPLEEEKETMTKTLILLSIEVLKNHSLSILDKINDDNTRGVIATSVSTILQCLLPILRSPKDHDDNIVESCIYVIQSFSDNPSIVDPKIWRKDISDLFIYSSTFFETSPSQIKAWMKVVNALFLPKDDSSPWFEFIKNLSRSLLSTSTYTSSDGEQVSLKSLNIKKLAFIILCGVKDQYLDQLPLIQEKVVEAIKGREGPESYVSVFLCLRVLLLKINQNAQRSFWPVIISEMLKVFMEPEPKSILAVTKYLDLVFVLKSEQFSIYDWMFINESFNFNDDRHKPPFVPFIDQLTYVNHQDDYDDIVKPTLLTKITKIGNDKNSKEYQELLSFLSKYSRLQYKNRMETRNNADIEEIENEVVEDFSERRNEGSINDKEGINTFI